MSRKKQQPAKDSAQDDVRRMKSDFAKKHGGATPPPPHVRRIESAVARRKASEGR